MQSIGPKPLRRTAILINWWYQFSVNVRYTKQTHRYPIYYVCQLFCPRSLPPPPPNSNSCCLPLLFLLLPPILKCKLSAIFTSFHIVDSILNAHVVDVVHCIPSTGTSHIHTYTPYSDVLVVHTPSVYIFYNIIPKTTSFLLLRV